MLFLVGDNISIQSAAPICSCVGILSASRQTPNGSLEHREKPADGNEIFLHTHTPTHIPTHLCFSLVPVGVWLKSEETVPMKTKRADFAAAVLRGRMVVAGGLGECCLYLTGSP